MAYTNLINAISAVVKTNGNGEITGQNMQDVLKSIVNTIGANATFAGIATPATVPPSTATNANVFYIASQNGIYSNFGGIVIADEVAILSNMGGSWTKISTDIAKAVLTLTRTFYSNERNLLNEFQFGIFGEHGKITPTPLRYDIFKREEGQGGSVDIINYTFASEIGDIDTSKQYLHVITLWHIIDGDDSINLNNSPNVFIYPGYTSAHKYKTYSKDGILYSVSKWATSQIENYQQFLAAIHLKNANLAVIARYEGSLIVPSDLEQLEVYCLDEILDIIKTRSVGVIDVANGIKNTYGNIDNITGVGTQIEKTSINSFNIIAAGSGFKWVALNRSFTPNASNLVRIKFNIKRQGSGVLQIWLSAGQQGYIEGKNEPIATLQSGRVDMTFDPAYYAVYKDPAWTTFNVWLVSNISTTPANVWEIEDFEVYQDIDSANTNIISGNNAKELFESTDTNLAYIKEQISAISDIRFTAPNGKKFELNVTNSGNVVAVPLLPSKIAYIGNSLLLGSGFGMAASAEDKDYYSLINSYINTLTTATATRFSGTAFEGAENEQAAQGAITYITNQLQGDVNLVVVQLGDNVNTAAKNQMFAQYCEPLMAAIREKCPNARVVWMGMWYSTPEKYEVIEIASQNTGVKFMTFEGLKSSSANSHIGAVQKLTSSATRTISGVTAVNEIGTESGYTVISATYVISGVTYTSQFGCTSYNLVNDVLTYVSDYNVITSGGVASHPGDEGFRRIANKFLYFMGFSESEETYPPYN